MKSDVLGNDIEFVNSIQTFLFAEIAPMRISGGIGLPLSRSAAAACLMSYFYLKTDAKKDPKSAPSLSYSLRGARSKTGS